jgi:hypothetical protein
MLAVIPDPSGAWVLVGNGNREGIRFLTMANGVGRFGDITTCGMMWHEME